MSSFQSLLTQISVSETDFCSENSSTDILFENNKYEWDALFLNKKNGLSSISVNSNGSDEKRHKSYLSNKINFQNEFTEKKTKRNRKFIRVSEFKLDNDIFEGNEAKKEMSEEI